jgi:four helix bundle protein
MHSGNYTGLLAWQRAMTLVEAVYAASSALPRDEQFGLTAQMRRAAVSVPANIAEGQGRRTDGEFLNQLSVAHGSLRELETEIMLAMRLKYLPDTAGRQLLTDAGEVGRLLNGLCRSLEQRR